MKPSRTLFLGVILGAGLALSLLGAIERGVLVATLACWANGFALGHLVARSRADRP